MPSTYFILAKALLKLDPRGFETFLFFRRLNRADRRSLAAGLLRAGMPYSRVVLMGRLVGGTV